MMNKEQLHNVLLQSGYVVRNEFLYKYINLIVECNCEHQKGKTSIHHILPKSYFLSTGKEIDNSNENTVTLLHKHHILAHYYLYKCASTPQYRKDNAATVVLMTNTQLRYTDEVSLVSSLDDYQLLVEEWHQKLSESQTGHIVSEETRRKIGEKNKLKKPYVRTEATLSKIRGDNNPSRRPEVIAKILKTKLENRTNAHSEETKRKISEARRGKVFVNNGVEMKYVKKEELSNFLSNGYTLGKLKKGKL